MNKEREDSIMKSKCNKMKRQIEKIEKVLEKINGLEKKFPKGELLCAKNSKHYKWYLKNQEGTFYLSKSKKELAEKLALKKYHDYKKQELQSELEACNAYLRKMLPKEGKTEQLLEHPEYGRLLNKYFIPVSKELFEWQNTPYEKSTKYEENLVIKGTGGKMLRSKSEAIIDMLLYENKIPFRYEEKLVLDGIAIYPDFVIRHPATGEYLYWEHFGLMDDENYIEHACDKVKLYCKNGIIPTINLIITYETMNHPLSVEEVEGIVQKYFLEGV